LKIDWHTPFKKLEIGEGRKIKDGNDLAIITIGHVGNDAVEAAEELEKRNIHPAIYDLRFLKPIDENLLHEVFKNFKNVMTVEDGTIIGGLGSAVVEFMAENGYNAHVKKLGIPDRFIQHGSIKELHKECHYYVDDIIEIAKKIV